jgi:phosphoenolpyruvate carboxykinase (ATP)
MAAPTPSIASTCAWSANWPGTTCSSATCCADPRVMSLTPSSPEFTIINCPSFKADPERHGCRTDTVIALNFEKKLILIANTEYAGENKKSVFTLLNYILPGKGVMAMHCSANHANGDPDDAAVFFGLSGTGKTTLSACQTRTLIGDDEHGWSDRGTFNFEGGCYAKTINLREEAEPEIFATPRNFGTVIENMVYDPETLELDFDDDSLTAEHPLRLPAGADPERVVHGAGGHPKNIVMLTCDAFGVLPPDRAADAGAGDVSLPVGLHLQGRGHRARRDRARAHLLHLFRRALHAAPARGLRQLLQDKIHDYGATCWLVNTGWTGGAYGTGNRMPIKATRALLTAALDGSLNAGQFRKDPHFGFEVPVSCHGVDDALLDPRQTWADGGV